MPNHYIVFLKAIVTLTAITLGERLLFFIYGAAPTHGFSTSELAYTVFWGLRFDAAVAGMLALLAYLLAYFATRVFRIHFLTVIRPCLSIAAVGIILLQGADIMYFTETGRHVGYEILDFFNDAYSLFGTAVNAYRETFFLHIAMAIASVWLIQVLFRSPEKTLFSSKRDWRWLRQPELNLVLMLLTAIILVRGGFQSIPQSPLSAQAIGDNRKATLALNGAYNALYSAISGSHVNPIKITLTDTIKPNDVIKQLYPPLQADNPLDQAIPANVATHPVYNIVTILLESWPAAFMKSYGFNLDVTPNFDELRKHSLTTYAMLAGGHRTTEGMFAVYCSEQNPLGHSVAQSQLQSFHYQCLPQILREQGYYTAFFQGTNKNTSGTGNFAQLLGFTDSFGRKDVTKRHYEENSWGVHDPDLYNFVYEKMHQVRQPFLMGINTATTHDITLPNGVKPFVDPANVKDPMINVMHFADAALKDFVDAVERDATLGPTVFVLVADHTAALLPSNYQRYSIPFLITGPGIVKPRYIDRVASQRDIAPTLLDLLGKSIPPEFAGKSLLTDDDPPYFADYYNYGTIGWIENNALMEIPVVNPKGYRCYDYRNDPLQRHPVACSSDAGQLLQHALAFTSVSQQLLFSGHIDEFANLKAQATVKVGMHSPKSVTEAILPQ